MTSKERVLTAVARHPVDKVPVDLGSNIQCGIHAYAYDNLKRALGINSGEIEIMDTYIMAATVEETVARELRVDAVPLLCPFDGLGMQNGRSTEKWRMPNGLEVRVPADFSPEKQADGSYVLRKNGFTFRMPSDGFYFDAVGYVLENAETEEDVDACFNFTAYGPREVEYLREASKKLLNTDRAVVGDIFASFSAEDNFGYEKAMIYLLTNANLIEYFMERLTDLFIRNFDVFYGVVGNVVDIMMMHKDMGNMLGPMVDPALARKVFFPKFKRFVSHVKSKSNYKIMMHNCGSIYELIPDIIAAGIDILNPIQISAKNMEPAKLKREFGKDICFWGGGVDTQRILPFGSEEDVRRQVRQNAEAFAPGGGYVFNPVHCVQAGVPARNIAAAFDEINRFGIA
jgi:uroporphyrinogen decarboxylase